MHFLSVDVHNRSMLDWFSPEIVKSITKSSLIYVQKGNIIQEDYRNKEYDVESIVLKEKFNDNHRKAFEY